MAFIGNTNTTQAFTPAVDYFSGNASTTAFTLSRPVASVAQVQAVVNNVAQNPSSAFTVSGNTITFTSAPSSGTNNIYVYYTSPITQVIAPGQGTVGLTQLSATGTPSSSTFLRGDNAWSGLSATDITTGTLAKARLPTGTVLQVVQGTYSTETETSSSTFTDTGLTASITPSSASNKVLVIVSQDIGKRTNDLQANLRLMRGATSLGNFASLATNSAVTVFGSGNGGAYLDSPATTSATTYKTQFNSSNGLAAARVCNGGQLSTITLMEIAA